MNNEQPTTASDESKKRSKVPTFSTVLDDGRLVELLYDPVERRTRFGVSEDGEWHFEDSISLDGRQRLVPYSPENSLLRNQIVLLPSEPEEYGSEQELVRDIKTYIHRYVDLSPQFERIATYYVLFSWIYDNYNELAYLRFRGDYGTRRCRPQLAYMRLNVLILFLFFRAYATGQCCGQSCLLFSLIFSFHIPLTINQKGGNVGTYWFADAEVFVAPFLGSCV